MKVRTHIKAGQFVAAAPTALGNGAGLGSQLGDALADNKARRTLAELLNDEIKPWLLAMRFPYTDPETLKRQLSTSTSYTAADAAMQAFVMRWIDPILGDSRAAQMQQLSGSKTPMAPGPQEQRANRNVVISMITIGSSILGNLLAPPLTVVAALGSIYVSFPFFEDAVVGVVKDRKINTYVPLALTIAIAWALGYYNVVGLFSLIGAISRKILLKTQQEAHESLASVFGQRPQSVWAVVDGIEIQIPFEQVQVGDMLVVMAGQQIPVDGAITQGMAIVDQHMLTGEAQPVEKEVGDSVLAATVVLTGKIYVLVEKAGADVAAAQIASILNRTSSYQTSIETKALVIANRGAVPTLVLGGIGLVTLGWQAAAALLLIALGSPMMALGPILVLNYLRLLSGSGILVKDGRSLELLKQVDTIVFDKTGTLTLEQPHLAQVHCLAGWSDDDVLRLAATAEQRQSHPIAQAILAAARQRGLTIDQVDEIHYQVGFGIQVGLGGQVVRVGSARFMHMEGIELPAAVTDLQERYTDAGYSFVLVAVDQQVIGSLELHATPRPEAQQLIQRLHKRGLTLYILSGDQEAPTRRMAEDLGIDHYMAGVLPEAKAAMIEQLQAQGKSVCFVGDGINDAIALRKANVSISLRGATTVATDAAQIVLMDQSLNQFGTLLDWADEMDSTFRRCLLCVLAPDIIVIPGVFFFGIGVPVSMLLYMSSFVAGVGMTLWPLFKHKDILANQSTVSTPPPLEVSTHAPASPAVLALPAIATG